MDLQLFKGLAEFGITGFFILALLVIAYFLWQRVTKMQDQLSAKFEQYQREDREKLISVIEKNTTAFNELHIFIAKFKNEQ
jgi:nitrogen regulatory protein PII-like uncharacterized protein